MSHRIHFSHLGRAHDDDDASVRDPISDTVGIERVSHGDESESDVSVAGFEDREERRHVCCIHAPVSRLWEATYVGSCGSLTRDRRTENLVAQCFQVFLSEDLILYFQLFLQMRSAHRRCEPWVEKRRHERWAARRRHGLWAAGLLSRSCVLVVVTGVLL